MPNWVFGLLSAGLFAVYFILPWRIKRLGIFLHPFETPDRALAFFALFFGSQVLLQQTTGYPFGVVYQFSDSAARHVIETGSLYSIFKEIGVIVSAVYWILTACALFAVASLIRGTIRDFRHSNEPMSHQDAQTLIQNMQSERDGIDKVIQQQHKDMQQQHRDMLEIIKRMDIRIALLEAQNGNKAPTTKPKRPN